jgi:hypothetical protein
MGIARRLADWLRVESSTIPKCAWLYRRMFLLSIAEAAVSLPRDVAGGIVLHRTAIAQVLV